MKLYEQNPHYVQYVVLLEQLHALVRDGRGDSPEADALREQMDEPWRHLAAEETVKVKEMSERLNAAPDARAERGPPSGRDGWNASFRLVIADDADTAREGIRILLGDADVEVVSLTPPEVRVLREVARGLTNREIAGALHVSVEIVKEHVRAILGKVGVAKAEDRATP